MTVLAVNNTTGNLTSVQMIALIEQMKIDLKTAKANEKNKDKKFIFNITEKKGVVFGMGKEQKSNIYGSWANMEQIEGLIANLDNIKKAMALVNDKGFSALSSEYKYIGKAKEI